MAVSGVASFERFFRETATGWVNSVNASGSIP